MEGAQLNDAGWEVEGSGARGCLRRQVALADGGSTLCPYCTLTLSGVKLGERRSGTDYDSQCIVCLEGFAIS